MADVEAEVASGQPKKRTFRKFSYRGVDLDALLDMSTDEPVKIFPARVRRSCCLRPQLRSCNSFCCLVEVGIPFLCPMEVICLLVSVDLNTTLSVKFEACQDTMLLNAGTMIDLSFQSNLQAYIAKEDASSADWFLDSGSSSHPTSDASHIKREAPPVRSQSQ